LHARKDDYGGQNLVWLLLFWYCWIFYSFLCFFYSDCFSFCSFHFNIYNFVFFYLSLKLFVSSYC
jgi:hypothetical protein